VKNVTISLDDESYRIARIRAAERGTSLSAMVKEYLGNLDAAETVGGVKEMPMTFTAQTGTVPVRKLRQPGGLRGKIGMAGDFDIWPEEVLASFEAWPYDDEPARA
jgi:plasmid stability protein